MAVTKIWRVRGKVGNVIDYANDPEKTVGSLPSDELSDIADVLEYADDERKTENHFYTTGINCDRVSAKEDFAFTKNRFGKPGGIVAIHGYQSFEEEDISPAIAHEIGVKLAKELWGDRFQVLVATHLNSGHTHNHFIVNSVSFRDGKRFHMCTDRYLEMRAASDRLCKEYNLSVIEKPQNKRVPLNLYKMEEAGMPTRYNVARQTIDDAIAVSVNMREFMAELSRQGYTYRFVPTRKYWTITPPGWTKPIRINKLGPEYTKERITERIFSNDVSVRANKTLTPFRPAQYKLNRRVNRIMGRSGLEKLYLRYCYELGVLPKYTQNRRKLHRVLKEDLLKCDLYSEEAKLLSRNKIATDEDLSKYMERLGVRMTQVSEERDELRKLIKRVIPEEEREAAKGRVASLTAELKDIRRDLKLCEDIERRSGDIEKNLEVISKEQKEKEVNRA